MKRSTFLSIAAFVALLFGLGLLIVPDNFLGMYGVTLDDGGRLVGRSLGAFLFSIGLVNWIARRAEDSLALRAILYGNLAIHLLTMVLDASAVTSGVINAQGWGAVGLHLVFGLGFAYYAFAKPKAA